jgi:undecaprenyl-diphosphatase
MVASAITGALAVGLVLRVVRTHSFTPFVVYRVGVAAVVLVLLATGVR